MNEPSQDTPSGDDRLDEILVEYLQAVEAGNTPDQQELLRKHPEIAAELTEFFMNKAFFEQVAPPVLQFGEDRSAAADSTPPQREAAGDSQSTIDTEPATDIHVPVRIRYFGDYELLEEIARGGMGVVYKARQTTLKRVVALKMILAGQLANTQEVQRFHAEAEAAARLDHPHIVPIYEIGQHKGQHYFSMALVDGESLARQLCDGVLTPRAAADIMVKVSKAIAYAHAEGVVHRDLKPGNILIDQDGEPRVTDFGLAKRVESDEQLTATGQILGTPGYMPPEQAGGDSANITQRTDVYSLGAVLYSLVTGRPPFQAASPMETLLQVMSREPVSPRLLNPTVSRDLETIILKCLEKEPSRRYQTAQELVDELSRFMNGKPIVARPVTTAERVVKWYRRQPLLAGSLATIIAATLGLLILAGSLWKNAELRARAVQNLDDAKVQLAQVDDERVQAEAEKNRSAKTAEQQTKLADAQKVLAGKIAAEVRQLEMDSAVAKKQLAATRVEAGRTMYAADMQLAHAAWQSDNISGVDELLKRYRKPVGDDPRGFEWYFLYGRAHGARLEWNTREQPSLFQPIRSLAISPDGKTLATWDAPPGYSKDIMLWDSESGKYLKTIAIGGESMGINHRHVEGLAFADDGSTLVAAIYNFDQVREIQNIIAAAQRKDKLDLQLLQDHLEIHSWNLADDSPAQIAQFDLAKAPFPLFSVVSEGIRIQHDGDPMMARCVAKSPDGKFIAFAGWPLLIDEPAKDLTVSSGGRLIIWDVLKARVRAIHNAPTGIYASAFSPDGAQLAIGDSDGIVGVCTLDFDGPLRLFIGHRGYVGAIVFSADGSRLFSGAADGQIIEWDVATSKAIARRRDHTSAVHCLEISADGETLVSGGDDGAIKLWNLGRSTEPLVIRGHARAILSLAFADNGRELISADRAGAVKTWAATDGRLLRGSVIKGVTENLRLAPSGKNLVWTSFQSLKVQNLTNGKETELTWKDNNPFAVALSDDDKWAATGNLIDTDLKSRGLTVWDITDGKQVAALHEKGPTRGLIFSTDNKRLIAAHESGVIVWDWQTKQIRRLEPAGVMHIVAVSNDDELVAAATVGAVGRQSIVRIWDLKTNVLKVEFQGAGRQVRHLAFTPDGRRLATVGDTSLRQNVLKLWDSSGGREVFTAPMPSGTITAIAFSPDGNRLAAATLANGPTDAYASGNPPGEIHLWDATPISNP